jgi:hypothetical protein
LFEQGKYYIHPDHLEARDELLTIGSSRWDDVVDAMASAEQLLVPIFMDTSSSQVEVKDTVRGTSGYGEEY